MTAYWMQTNSGIAFEFPPTLDMIELQDIAHALAHQCRFGGHTKSFYSVAQHSVLVSHVCAPEAAFQGLMHDAAEAYVADMIRPLKVMPEMRPYRKMEDAVWRKIAEKFNVPVEFHPSIKLADDIVLLTEKRDLLAPSPRPWTLVNSKASTADLLPDPIIPWDPEKSKANFLARYWMTRP